MSFFDLFKSKMKVVLSEEELKWNKIWELWTESKAASPYAELMTYQSEINNGGHFQYFINVQNTGDLPKEMSTIEHILSAELKNNLQKAYEAYLVLEEKGEDEMAEETLERCDAIYYEREAEINSILKGYAAKLSL